MHKYKFELFECLTDVSMNVALSLRLHVIAWHLVGVFVGCIHTRDRWYCYTAHCGWDAREICKYPLSRDVTIYNR